MSNIHVKKLVDTRGQMGQINYNVAHTRGSEEEPLYDDIQSHSNKVYLEGLKNPFIHYANPLWRPTALLHDYGKLCKEFWERIKGLNANPDVDTDHCNAGLQFIFSNSKLTASNNHAMAFAINGHHIGLQNTDDIIQAKSKSVNKVIGEPNDITSLKFAPHSMDYTNGMFEYQLFIRLLISMLVQSDHAATAAFYNQNTTSKRFKWEYLEQVLLSYTQSLKDSKNNISSARKDLFDLCADAGKKGAPHMELEAPTGSGKTLSSLRYAISNAIKSGSDKIIYVIPFNAITEQFTKTFHEIFKDDGLILNHYHTFDSTGNPAHRHQANTWDSQIIITTYVQFFESFFSPKTNKLKKCTSVVNSTIIFDEIQSINFYYFYPCIKLINALTKQYNCNVLTMSATHFKIPSELGLKGGKKILSAKKTKEMFEVFGERINFSIDRKLGCNRTTAKAVNNYNGSALVICNMKKTATDIYRSLRGEKYYLSTNMCAAHRKQVLTEISNRLNHNTPIKVVSTSLIEAGVDLSFDRVYREHTGLDAVSQAAGRCNRHGTQKVGEVILFRSDDTDNIKTHVENFDIYRKAKNWKSPLTIRKYFKQYFILHHFVDNPNIDHNFGKKEFADNFYDGICKFKDYSFNLIPDDTFSVFVNYQTNYTKQDIKNMIENGQELLQKNIVSVQTKKKKDLIDSNTIFQLTDDLFMLYSETDYNSEVGLSVEQVGQTYDIY